LFSFVPAAAVVREENYNKKRSEEEEEEKGKRGGKRKTVSFMSVNRPSEILLVTPLWPSENLLQAPHKILLLCTLGVLGSPR